MEQKGLREDIHKLWEEVIKYFELKWEIFRLDIVESLSLLYSRLFSLLVWWVVISAFLFFVLTGLALYLGTLWGKMYLGFLAVAGGVLVLGLIFILIKRPLLTNHLINVLISAMFEQEQVEQKQRKKYENTTGTNKKYE